MDAVCSDQTVRLMNKGLTPDEIVKSLTASKSKRIALFGEFYGTVDILLEDF
ncbi:MAG: hypothetical protein Ct9H90mP6_07340 [Gammaproteobacteria bacterium]|nr:MAG: hypothetical protein Ct9H90mP6_07340 [Gammaproteobacteria bacterium]